jgi:hypothetical protein
MIVFEFHVVMIIEEEKSLKRYLMFQGKLHDLIGIEGGDLQQIAMPRNLAYGCSH